MTGYESREFIAEISRLSMGENHAVEKSLPARLYDMLECVGKLGLDDTVKWLPHGRAFIVKDRALFSSVVLPSFFGGVTLRRFVELLHLYQFKR